MAIITYAENFGFYLIRPDGSPISAAVFSKATDAERHAARLGLSVLNSCADTCDD